MDRALQRVLNILPILFIKESIQIFLKNLKIIIKVK